MPTRVRGLGDPGCRINAGSSRAASAATRASAIRSASFTTRRSRRRPRPRLRVAEHVALTAQPEVDLGQFETVEGRATASTRWRAASRRRLGDEQAESGHTSTDAPRLVQLRDAEPVGFEDRHRRGVRHVDADLDDRRRDEHIDLAARRPRRRRPFVGRHLVRILTRCREAGPDSIGATWTTPQREWASLRPRRPVHRPCRPSWPRRRRSRAHDERLAPLRDPLRSAPTPVRTSPVFQRGYQASDARRPSGIVRMVDASSRRTPSWRPCADGRREHERVRRLTLSRARALLDAEPVLLVDDDEPEIREGFVSLSSVVPITISAWPMRWQERVGLRSAAASAGQERRHESGASWGRAWAIERTSGPRALRWGRSRDRPRSRRPQHRPNATTAREPTSPWTSRFIGQSPSRSWAICAPTAI